MDKSKVARALAEFAMAQSDVVFGHDNEWFKDIVEHIEQALTDTWNEAIDEAIERVELSNNCSHCHADCREDACVCEIYKSIAQTLRS